MTYIFTGVLSTDAIKAPVPDDNETYVFRRIVHRSLRFGVLFPEQAEEQIARPNGDTEQLIAEIKNEGIVSGVWMYYQCWGGQLEIVAHAKVVESRVISSSYVCEDKVTYDDLSRIFNSLEILVDDNGHFEPFVRNFWGAHGF